jgi:hypothetical protein
VGAIPVGGDLFDFAWKSNQMNFALLELHAAEERSASASDWLFVIAMMVLALVIAVAPFVLIVWLFTAVTGLFR